MSRQPGSAPSTRTSVRAPAERSLAFAVEAMRGSWLTPAIPHATFAGAAFDSRRVAPGQLFFALPGAHVDGFDYLLPPRPSRCGGAGGGCPSRDSTGTARGAAWRRPGLSGDRRRRSFGRARGSGARDPGDVLGARRWHHGIEWQDHDQGTDGRSARRGGSGPGDQRQLQHRNWPAPDDPVGIRDRGFLGAGDGDARARTDRAAG